jgi:hypothetical protein
MAHSNESCEFVITNDGLNLLGASNSTPDPTGDAERRWWKGQEGHAIG